MTSLLRLIERCFECKAGPRVWQILFLSGLAFVIGLERTFRFFFQSHKLRGSASFFGGILIVLVGWPLVGMMVELYGFVVLFR